MQMAAQTMKSGMILPHRIGNAPPLIGRRSEDV